MVWVVGVVETRPAGLEPATYGLEIRCSQNTNSAKTKTCKISEQQSTPQSTPESQKQGQIDTSNLPPDLAEIVSVWPELPEHIRQAIKALVRSSNA